MPELIRRAHAAAKAFGVEVVCFGHAGDGNIHVDFIRRDALDPRWEAGIGPAVRAVLEATVALGGSVTAEHGVGLLRRGDLPLSSTATLAAMAHQTRPGPQGTPEPGKIWPQ
jgi:glycolate oxidase